MNVFKPLGQALLVSLAGISITSAAEAIQQPTAGQILVVLSGAQELALRDGKSYRTGYFLNELAIPLKKIVDAGYIPVFASPGGKTPAMDANSNNKFFFGNDESARAAAYKFVSDFAALKHPIKLSNAAKSGSHSYAGIFIPGGHAPMQDLVHDKSLGTILQSFHEAGKPTGIICHGPIALLSATSDPVGYEKALINGDKAATSRYAKDWPYAGYRMTVFSNSEEKQGEGPGKQLGGEVRLYAEDALRAAGANLDEAADWQSKVVVDRELVTGQQPFSDKAFADTFVSQLKAAHQ